MTRPAAQVPGWFPLSAVAVVSAVCAGLLALGCEAGNAGQVCTEPDAADCPSNTGGEVSP